MLVFLSEMNILRQLNALDLYPDRLYTDFERFREEYRFFDEATVCLVFAGSNRFNKTVTLKFYSQLVAQGDVGNIAKMYIFSDVVLPSIQRYYLYHGNLGTVDIMRGEKCLKRGVAPWSKLKSEPRQCQKRLSEYDMHDADGMREAYKAYRYSKAEDEYVNLIKVPVI